MLLSLLPLVGWADDVKVYPLPATATYGTAFTLTEANVQITGETTNVDAGAKTAIVGLLKVKETFEATTAKGEHNYSLAFKDISETSVTSGVHTFNVIVATGDGSINVVNIEKGNAVVTTGPSYVAAGLTYTSDDKTLVDASGVDAKCGTVNVPLVYSLTEDGTYESTLPKGTNAGDYTVWYKVEGTDNYEGTTATQISGSYNIAPAVVTLDRDYITINNVNYAQDLDPNPTYDSNHLPYPGAQIYFKYRLGSATPKIASETTWSKSNAWEVRAYVDASTDGNYAAAYTLYKNFRVLGGVQEWETDGAPAVAGWNYDATPSTPTATAKYEGAAVTYQWAAEATPDTWNSWTDANSAPTAAGNYFLKATAAETTNYRQLVTDDVSFTIAQVPATTATVAANNRVFDGIEAELVTVTGAATHGTMKYSTDGETYGNDVPVATAAGDYTVYYYAEAENTNYSSTDIQQVAVTISDQPFTVTAPIAVTGLTYNGTAQALVNPVVLSVPAGATVKYSLTAADADDFAEDNYSVTNAGDYTVYWKAEVADNYTTESATSGSVEVSVEKMGLVYALGNQTSEYTGEEITPNGNYAKMAGTFGAGENLSTVATFTFGDEPTNVADSKSYNELQVNFKNLPGSETETYAKNYDITFSGSSKLTITPKALTDDSWITEFTETAVYDGKIQEPTITTTLTENTDYTLTKPAGDVKAAGEYTYTFAPTGNYSGDAVEKTFTITGKGVAESMLKMTSPKAWPAAALTFNDKDQKPTFTLEDAAIQVNKKNYVLTADDYDLTINDQPAAEVEVKAQGTYTFVFTGKGNYAGTGEAASFTKTLTIGEKGLAAGDFTLAAETAVYNNENQLPAVTTSLTDADYTLVITNKNDDEVEEAVNVDTYTFTFTGKGNYSGEIQKTFTITPATAFVSVAANVSKNYDGNANFGTEKPALEYSGLKGADTKAAITVTGEEYEAVTIKDADSAPGVYDLEVDLTKLSAVNYIIAANSEITRTFTIKELEEMVVSFKNNFVVKDGKTTTEVTEAFKKEYGQAIAFDDEWKAANIQVTGAKAGEEDAIIAGVEVTREDGKDVGTYALTISAKADAEIFDNYKDPFFAAGTFEITPATLTVGLKEDEGKVYDGNAPEAIVVTKEKLAVSGFQWEDGIDVITTLPNAAIVDPSKNQGTYTIQLSEAAAKNYEFNYVDARYVITPKKLAKGSVTIDEQTLQAGSLASGFDENAYNVTNLEGTDDYTKIWKIKVAAAHITKVDGKDVITGETDAAGIELYVEDEVAAANYEFDAAEVTTGNLVIAAASSIYLSRGDRATKSIAAGADNIFAANTNNATVEFDAFAMTAKTWYAMVLPFDVTMMQLIEAFGGYVAVDVVDGKNADTSRMNFELNGATVTAHTPFLIKLFADKNLNTVKFTGVNVKATKGANTTVSDAAENQFIGTYEGKKFAGDNANCYILSLTSGKFQPASETATVYPLGAYVKTAAAGARIFIEEEDGTVTEIESINADGTVVEAGAWYTVNGMKLDKAPTEKGVYIKNGKKVVVK